MNLLHFQSELGTGMNESDGTPNHLQMVSRKKPTATTPPALSAKSLRFKVTFWKTLFISGQVIVAMGELKLVA